MTTETQPKKRDEAALWLNMVSSVIHGHGHRFVALAKAEITEKIAGQKHPRKYYTDALHLLAQVEKQGALQMLVHKDVQSFCFVSEPNASLSYFHADSSTVARFGSWLLEHKNRQLLPPGLMTRNRLLLHGPPGTGKTYLSKVLATELGLPLVEVNVNSLLEGVLGASPNNVRRLFEQIKKVRAVYFFDEIDALTAYRTYGSSSSRENTRISVELMRGLDSIRDTDALLVAATNNISVLDPAVKRRFFHIELAAPKFETAWKIVEQELLRFVTQEEIEELFGTENGGLERMKYDLKQHLKVGITGSYLVELVHEAVQAKILSGMGLLEALCRGFERLRRDLAEQANKVSDELRG